MKTEGEVGIADMMWCFRSYAKTDGKEIPVQKEIQSIGFFFTPSVSVLFESVQSNTKLPVSSTPTIFLEGSWC